MASEDSSDASRSSVDIWAQLCRILRTEDLGYLLSNRIPRRLATRIMGWYSKLELGWLTQLSIAVWRWFSPDLDLSEARERRFASVHACFVRELAPGLRPIDPRPEIVTSPCDAILGAHGRIEKGAVFQAKGLPYTLTELLQDPELAASYEGGNFATLRLKASFYHRFHSPCDAAIRELRYLSGDTFNVNPIALRRIERLFCRNERAAIELELGDRRQKILLVPVAAILVASIRLCFLPEPLDLRARGTHRIECETHVTKGEELGWFEHGSTILIFAVGGFEFVPGLAEGRRLRVGEPLFQGLRASSISLALEG